MSLFNKVTKTFNWGQHTVTMETGEIARQASGAVLVNIDDTVVLATVVASKGSKPGQDFFPLTVDYIEKTYAAGKIPGGFFKREGRPSEKETLTCRLIDRPIRPLFVDGFISEGELKALQKAGAVGEIWLARDGATRIAVLKQATLLDGGFECVTLTKGATALREGYPIVVDLDGRYIRGVPQESHPLDLVQFHSCFLA